MKRESTTSKETRHRTKDLKELDKCDVAVEGETLAYEDTSLILGFFNSLCW